ncbi:MAG: zinc-binding dehydrogenase [Actinomycetota bacterium]
MRAVRCSGAGVEVTDVVAPSGPGVRVRVRSAGICGSDVEMVRLGLATVTIGHEVAGVLDDGTPVAVHPFTPCGACEECRTGRSHLCRTVVSSMLGAGRDGGMSDELLVDPSMVVPLPDRVGVWDASLVEPLAVALHACHRGAVGPGLRVGVVGAGTIGLACAAVARHLGADAVISARHPHQARAAEALGVRVGDDRDCDVVIDAAGTASGFDAATARCRRAGTLLLASTTWEPITVSFFRAQMREITLVPAFVYGEAHGEPEFTTASRILADHPEIPEALITHRFGLDEAARAFAVAADRAAGAIKVVLHP